MDKIYIPTLGRCENQITWDHLPVFLKSITKLVVQPKEQPFFKDKPHIVLPGNDIGMSNTRKWIWEHGKNEIYGVFDDDLKFIKRTPKQKPTKTPMTENDWKTVIAGVDKWLNGEFGFAGFLRGNLPPRDENASVNTESLQATFYNGKKLPKVNEIEWTPNQYAQDTKIHLQLFLKGYKNKVWNSYGFTSKQFAEGGCQADTSVSPNGRTPEDRDKSHQHIVDTYYPYVQYITKNGVVVRYADGARQIRVVNAGAIIHHWPE